MIARTNRFHGRASIARLYAQSKSVRSGNLALRYGVNPRRQTYRAAVVVSKKISKSAVVRNRIRRRIYECVRILSSELNKPYDLIFIVYDEKIAAMDAHELSVEVIKLCKKAKLVTANPGGHDIVKSPTTRST